LATENCLNQPHFIEVPVPRELEVRLMCFIGYQVCMLYYISIGFYNCSNGVVYCCFSFLLPVKTQTSVNYLHVIIFPFSPYSGKQ
jgi:hypothetical protein